jgi:hypothetical protein
MKIEDLNRAWCLQQKLGIAYRERKQLGEFIDSYNPDKSPVEGSPLYLSTRGDSAGLELRLVDPETVIEFLKVVHAQKELEIKQLEKELKSL